MHLTAYLAFLIGAGTHLTVHAVLALSSDMLPLIPMLQSTINEHPAPITQPPPASTISCSSLLSTPVSVPSDKLPTFSPAPTVTSFHITTLTTPLPTSVSALPTTSVPLASSTSTPLTSSTSAPLASSASPSTQANFGTIIGCVIGGALGLILILILLAKTLQRRRRKAQGRLGGPDLECETPSSEHNNSPFPCNSSTAAQGGWADLSAGESKAPGSSVAGAQPADTLPIHMAQEMTMTAKPFQFFPRHPYAQIRDEPSPAQQTRNVESTSLDSRERGVLGVQTASPGVDNNLAASNAHPMSNGGDLSPADIDMLTIGVAEILEQMAQGDIAFMDEE